PTSGHVGHVDTENRDLGPHSWVRHLAAHAPSLEGGAARAARFALSGPAPSGKARMADRRVGRIRERPAGQVLQAVAERQEAAEQRTIKLESSGWGGGANSRDRLVGALYALVEISLSRKSPRWAVRLRTALSHRETYRGKHGQGDDTARS